jgi:hypothetical protein
MGCSGSPAVRSAGIETAALFGRPCEAVSMPAACAGESTIREFYQRRAASSTRPELASADRRRSARKVPDLMRFFIAVPFVG